MGDRLDQLFQQWRGVGGAVLLAERGPALAQTSPERLLAETTAHCRDSGRLTWVALDWLIVHIDELDERVLLEEARIHGDQAVLGVLSDAACQRRPHPKLGWLVDQCRRNPRLEVFFHRVARSPLASDLTRRQALDLFRRWNFLSNELRYLDDGRTRLATAVLSQGERP